MWGRGVPLGPDLSSVVWSSKSQTVIEIELGSLAVFTSQSGELRDPKA